MATTLDLSGLGKLKAKFVKVQNPDATTLMISWKKIIVDDNRRGVLAGLDKNGVPMIPVTYRPVGTPIKIRKQSREYNAAGIAGNLTSSQYRRLTGPPLAPRGQFSRVITNLQPDFQDGRTTKPWMAWAKWKGVVSKKGVSFLPYHFHTEPSRLPKRDLTGVRPDGIQKALSSLRNWAIGAVREAFR